MRSPTVLTFLSFVATFIFALAQVSVIPPDDTKAGFRLSGYNLSLSDPSISSQVSAAVKDKQNVSVYSVSLKFPKSLNVTGIPVFRAYAHKGTALDGQGEVKITSRGMDGNNASSIKPPPDGTGKEGKKGETGGSGGVGGTVLI